MDWNASCNLARVRMLAIAAEVRAGGDPSEPRMRRALAPIVDRFLADLGAAGRAAAKRSPAARRRGDRPAASPRNCRE